MFDPTVHHPTTTTTTTTHQSPTVDKLAFLVDKFKSIDHLLQVHAVLLRHGLHHHPVLNFNLQRAYSSIGRLDYSLALFKHTHSQNIEPQKALHSQTIRLEFDSDSYVRTGHVDVYARRGDLAYAQQLFDTMPKKSLVSLTAMITCYAKHGELDKARVLFEDMEDRDVVCWNAIIDGYAQNGMPNEALLLFRQMLAARVKPNEVTVLAALSACGQLGALESGRWLHSYIENNRIDINVHVGTALVDMYSKCGSLEDARLVFDRIKDQDVVAWNSMIVVYAMHGFSRDALRLFHEMCAAGHHPSDITFIGMLSACSHADYGCMVNLLGRAGHLKEAYFLVKGTTEPDPVLRGTLLGACRLHGNIALGEEIAEYLVGKNLANSGTYILLSDIYEATGNWEGWVQKEPGCSSIEVNNMVHEFLAGDRRHPKSKEIYMTNPFHNEKLAIALGLIGTQPGSTIKIVKNYRVCLDCHAVTKLISKITGREIVMRDRNRFHHFVNVSCSYGDYR
ncbi:hypothetical protein CIPAW_01G009500 [Carya illinoinensis]|uniref:DYW domain-containing protein n=1 Tax=Carya illinoinensis TaxID=32201 RepID=A0A8T1RIG9_CARIL|nr:hypothetical protein CIPAW_01G009500 [Carya illinoinensis]